MTMGGDLNASPGKKPKVTKELTNFMDDDDDDKAVASEEEEQVKKEPENEKHKKLRIVTKQMMTP